MAATDVFIHADAGELLVNSKIATVINPGEYQNNFGDKGNFSLRLVASQDLPQQPKIGVLTGTFDPPHIGHKELALKMKKQFGLDYVYFIPTDIAEYKPNKQSLESRKKLLALLLEDDTSLKLLPPDLEKKVSGLHGNVVFKVLKDNLTTSKIFAIMGEDTFDIYRNNPTTYTLPKDISLLVNRRNGYKDIPIPTSLYGNSVSVIEDANVFGRVLRGKSADDFKTMSDDPARKIIFFMNEKQVAEAAKSNGDELLRRLGYTEEYISD